MNITKTGKRWPKEHEAKNCPGLYHDRLQTLKIVVKSKNLIGSAHQP